MSSRAILGFASIAGLVVSMALPAFAQTTQPSTPTQPTTTTPTTTTPTTTTTTPTTTTPATTPNCPPGTASTTNSNATTGTTPASSNPPGTTTTPATGNPSEPQRATGTKVANCPNTNTTTPSSGTMQNPPPEAPMTSTTNFNALNDNPNGPDWLAKFNRPNVRSNNYLGTTTKPMHRRMMRGTMMTRCHYVMEHGVRTKICK